ncbi:MAG: hypothetical protein SPF17_07970 [Candidatus Mucispirillum faecigallinarum]|nr:hypothetical protein [Candidatus Mucispirillum faecigallinarum]
MKKLLLAVLIMIIAVPAFAKDPKETVEYWKVDMNSKRDEAVTEINKCWNKSQDFFVVPVGSKQWNICCAIKAAYDGSGMTFQEMSDYMKRAKDDYVE